jgi:hypothetical protein
MESAQTCCGGRHARGGDHWNAETKVSSEFRITNDAAKLVLEF